VAAVAEIARRHDALFVLDAIQGLGVMQLDVEAAGVDFLSADARKWMVSPEGVGLGYASDRALERIEPAVEGWLAVEKPFDFFDLDQPLRASAGRYEEGALNVMGLHGMIGSLELLLSIGVARIEARILSLTDQVAEGLARAGWRVESPRNRTSEKSGIIRATARGVDFETLPERMRDAGVVISVRDGGLRVSPHAYNNEDDLARLFDTLSR
jgi:selenocysteine lyase/cysteine desulfurase